MSWLDDKHWELLNVDTEAVHLLVVEKGGIRPPYAEQKWRFMPLVLLRSDTIGGNRQDLRGLTLRSDHHLFDALSINHDYTTLGIQVNEYAITSHSVTERSTFLPLPQTPCVPFMPDFRQAQREGRVAFTLVFLPKPAFWQPLLRSFKGKAAPDAIGSLQVGDPATRRVHEVGHVLVYYKHDAYGPVSDAFGPILDVRWMPGGRRLSFVYLDELYTVPAD